MSTLTVWGENLDPEHVLQEYPRPQLVRDSYQNLNGYWEYAITASTVRPVNYPERIVVPFSPEAELSGVKRSLKPDEYAWYRRKVVLSQDLRRQTAAGDQLVVNFGAVDQIATIYVNGVEVGAHTGGYLPFSVQIDASHISEGTFTLEVLVQDRTDQVPLSRGKQRTKRGGIWYTPQSGIWQTVWLEALPIGAITRVDYVCAADLKSIEISTKALGHVAAPATFTISREGQRVASVEGVLGEEVRVNIADAALWSPETPNLYDLAIITEHDSVTSYFAMRTFAVAKDSTGIPRLMLNGSPYFHAGVLDQGYWPDGLYTAPSDEAFIWDIHTMKSMGFNMLRKHIKVEPMRFYYHCDRLGMLVWQDMISGGGSYKPLVITAPVALPVRLDDSTPKGHKSFAREDVAGREQFEVELEELITHLKAVPSIALWVPFNEGWGQFDAVRIAEKVRALDPTRLIDHASGWHDQKVSDVRSLHIYFKKFRVPKDDGTGRALVVSEYGGYNYEIPGSRTTDKTFGYRKMRTAQELERGFRRLHEQEIIPAVAKGLCATVYTQVSDVEDELNGLVSYDRRQVKIRPEAVAQVNRRIVSAM